MNLKNYCRLHRPYNGNHTCPFRLVKTVTVRAAGETSAERAEAKWDVRKMIPCLSQDTEWCIKFHYSLQPTAPSRCPCSFSFTNVLLLPTSQLQILSFFLFCTTTLIQSWLSQQYPSIWGDPRLVLSIKFHLSQVVLDVVFPSGLGLSYWSTCKWFPFLYQILPPAHNSYLLIYVTTF